MKKYIITSLDDRFSGEVYVIYGAADELQQIDFSSAQLSLQWVRWLKANIPAVHEKPLFPADAPLAIASEVYGVTFEMFWQRYDKKINAIRCRQIWDRLSKAEQASAYAGVTPYLRYLQKESWRPKADPETYFKKQYWKTDWK